MDDKNYFEVKYRKDGRITIKIIASETFSDLIDLLEEELDISVVDLISIFEKFTVDLENEVVYESKKRRR